MNRHKLFILSLFFACTHVLAQQETIKIWRGRMPGSIDDPTYKKEIIYINENSPRIYKVTDPTLDVYLAPPELSQGTAVVICPGGGYARLAADKEGHDIAAWFNKNGINAFVLKYRLPSDKIMENKSIGPLQDVQEALRIVRRNSAKWNLEINKIGVMGFSAGGHLASTASTHYNDKVYPVSDSTSARPDFSILIYPVISMKVSVTHSGSRENLLGLNPDEDLIKHFSNELQISAETPPTFLIHAADDKTVPLANSISYAQALKENSVPFEMHIFEKGGHGFGMAVNSAGTESIWPELCLSWLKTHGF